MNHRTILPRSGAAAATRPVALVFALLAALPLAAQHPLEVKPAPTPDPVKGWADPSPLSAAELTMLRRGGPEQPAGAGARPHAAGAATPAPDRVMFDSPGDGHSWAAGASWKASFGADGFVYVPYFGGDAPRNFPVRFVLRAVRVGGHALPLLAAAPERTGTRVVFARGAVREVYDLRPDAVEQTFVVDSAIAGDVEVELGVVSELVENGAQPGIQLGNELGCVTYGDAFVVDGAARHPVPTTCDGDTIRIHVPASARGAGPLVIDPIIQTTAFTAVHTGDASQPDIAYDATFDQYLVVWQHPFSATDMDVWCEFRDGNGGPIASTLDTIDFTSFSHQNPRVANLNAYDRFLVVTQRNNGTLWEIYGRLREAGQFVHPIVFPISASGGHCINPDVGGDSAATGTADNWLVVWQRELSATDYDIHGRAVRADTSFATGTIWIENSGASVYALPSVSQSNGNGFATAARWVVAYQFRFSANDWDVYGAALSQTGVITTPNAPIDTAFAMDLYASVSSPNTTAAGGNPLFLVTYERQGTYAARARLLSGGFVNQIPPVDLGAAFGFGPFWIRAECDGNRFTVTNGAAGIGAATLAYNGSALVLHDSPQALPGTPSYPRLCSKRSGGGPMTDVGIAYVEESTVPDRIGVTAYRSHAPGANASRRVMGCNGLGIDVAGRPFLGESLTFSLSNVGFDIPGFAFGVPVPPSTVFCGACPLGVDLTGVVLIVGTTLPIALPAHPSYHGVFGSVQGFGLGSGPCSLQLRFSDTIDFTIG